MTGMHQRWYRCEAKSHTLAVAHMHIGAHAMDAAADTRDYVYTQPLSRSYRLYLGVGTRQSHGKGKRATMEFEAKSPISSIDPPRLRAYNVSRQMHEFHDTSHSSLKEIFERSALKSKVDQRKIEVRLLRDRSTRKSEIIRNYSKA